MVLWESTNVDYRLAMTIEFMLVRTHALIVIF